MNRLFEAVRLIGPIVLVGLIIMLGGIELLNSVKIRTGSYPEKIFWAMVITVAIGVAYAIYWVGNQY